MAEYTGVPKKRSKGDRDFKGNFFFGHPVIELFFLALILKNLGLGHFKEKVSKIWRHNLKSGILKGLKYQSAFLDTTLGSLPFTSILEQISF